jgi:HEAT repeat protein
MKRQFILSSLLVLGLTACSLENVKDSKVQELAAEKNVSGLIAYASEKYPSFGAAQAVEALGEIGDKQAVEPLIGMLQQSSSPESSSESNRRQAAAKVLAQFKDERAFEPLVAATIDGNTNVSSAAKASLKELVASKPELVDRLLAKLGKDDKAAIEALGAIGQPALDPLIAALKDPESSVRLDATSALADIADPKAIPALVENLTDPFTAPMVGVALEFTKYEPATDADRIHYWIANKKGQELRQNWQMTKSVLLQDLETGDPEKIDYAIVSFIRIGEPNTIATLTQFLQEKGTKDLALAYLNCGHEELAKAGEDWANAQGYEVVRTETVNTQSTQWGEL